MEFKRNTESDRVEVIVTPSHPEGLFVFTDDYRGVCAVGQLTLSNFPGEVQRALETDDLSRVEDSVVGSGNRNEHGVGFYNTTAEATLPLPGTGNCTTVCVRTVTEMVPVVVAHDMVLARSLSVGC